MPSLLLTLPLVLSSGALAAPSGDPLAGVNGPAELVVTGFNVLEGPVWDEVQGGLLFSEFDLPSKNPGGRTHLLTEPSTVTLFREPSNNANGLAFDPNGFLISAEHHSRSVTRRVSSASTVTLADEWQGMPLNAPNDVAVRSDGTIYFSDPDFINPNPPLLGFNGLYRLDPGGTLYLEAVLDGPNGVVLSPDEQTLYVAEMLLGEVVTFDVAPGGSLSNPAVFASGMDTPDSMTVDVDGNLYVAVEAGDAGAVTVFAPDGTLWGSIAVPELARNCAFGSPDRRTLYITAGGSLYKLRLPIPGVGEALPLNYCTAGVSASGCQAALSSTGTASASASSGFSLTASGVEGAKDGLFFFGTKGRQANPWGNGTSLQCVVPPVFRAGLLAGSGTSGLCDGAFAQDINALWCAACPKPLKNPGPGAVVQAQLWYRDPFGTSNQTTSLSDALEFYVEP